MPCASPDSPVLGAEPDHLCRRIGYTLAVTADSQATATTMNLNPAVAGSCISLNNCFYEKTGTDHVFC
jgi:hypothetical protein